MSTFIKPLLTEFKTTLEKMKPSKVKAGKSSVRVVAPVGCNVFGSFQTKTSLKKFTSVDLSVEMDGDMFSAEDFREDGYIAKRRCFLDAVGRELLQRKRELVERVEYVAFNGDAEQPVLCVTLKKETKVGFLPIVIHPTLGGAILERAGVSANVAGNERQRERILSDVLKLEIAATAHGALCDSESLRAAVMLLKIWYIQRHRTTVLGTGSFKCAPMPSAGFFELVVAYLRKTGLVNGKTGSLQAFRMALTLLAGDELSTGVFLDGGAKKSARQPFLSTEHAVFVDESTRVNMTPFLTSNGLMRLKREAASTLPLLGSTNAVNAVLLTALPEEVVYDHVVTIHAFPTSKAAPSSEGGDLYTRCAGAAYRVLERALHSRVVALDVLPHDEYVWGLGAPCPAAEWEGRGQVSIRLGVVTNKETAFLPTELGPSAEDEEQSAAFRAFWGAKAEVRKFKDGTIRNAVVWGTDQVRPANIVRVIVLYALRHHFGIGADAVTLSSSQFDKYVAEQPPLALASAAFETLRQYVGEIRLPLDVLDIVAADKAFAGVCVYPPTLDSEKQGDWTPFIDVLVRFVPSGNWPDEYRAIQSIKTAFYLKMAEHLERHGECECRVLEQALLVHLGGFWFRLTIYCASERKTIRAQMKAALPAAKTKVKPLVSKLPVEPIAPGVGEQLLRGIRVTKEILPSHYGYLSALAKQHPSFPAAVSLTKQWVACQGMLPLIGEEAVELLVAALYAVPVLPADGALAPECKNIGWSAFPLYGVAAPHTALCAFLRVLFGLSTCREHPLTVVVGECAEPINEASANNAPALHVVAPYMKNSELTQKVSPLALQRLCVLAKNALKLINAVLFASAEKVNVSVLDQLFTLDMSQCDYVFKLHERAVTRRLQNIMGAPPAHRVKRLGGASFANTHKVPLLSFDPPQLLYDLIAKQYDRFVQLFFNPFGGDEIGLVWKPAAKEASTFNIERAYCGVPVREQGAGVKGKERWGVRVNLEQIVHDIQNVLGRGIVAAVTAKGGKRVFTSRAAAPEDEGASAGAEDVPVDSQRQSAADDAVAQQAVTSATPEHAEQKSTAHNTKQNRQHVKDLNDGKTHEKTGEKANERTDEKTKEKTTEQTNKKTNKKTKEKTKGKTDEKTDEKTKEGASTKHNENKGEAASEGEGADKGTANTQGKRRGKGKPVRGKGAQAGGKRKRV